MHSRKITVDAILWSPFRCVCRDFLCLLLQPTIVMRCSSNLICALVMTSSWPLTIFGHFEIQDGHHGNTTLPRVVGLGIFPVTFRKILDVNWLVVLHVFITMVTPNDHSFVTHVIAKEIIRWNQRPQVHHVQLHVLPVIPWSDPFFKFKPK